MKVEQKNQELSRQRSTQTAQPEESNAIRVTSGQLEAIAMRCHAELKESLRRGGTAAVAVLKENVLTVSVEHILAAAEQNLMRRSAGREFFQHYMEELMEQIYPMIARHVEQILPYSVTYARVKVDCESDSIIFSFGLRPRPNWAHTMTEASSFLMKR